MVKNREWEKIFDILDQGKIEKKSTRSRGSRNYQNSCPIVLKPFPDTLKVFMDDSSWQNRVQVQSIKDKLGVLTKEEFEESLKQNGFEENDLDTERNGSFLCEFGLEKSEQIFDLMKYTVYIY